MKYLKFLRTIADKLNVGMQKVKVFYSEIKTKINISAGTPLSEICFHNGGALLTFCYKAINPYK